MKYQTTFFNLTHLWGMALLLLLWSLYYPVTQAWFLADDPALLKNIAEHGLWQHFFNADIWKLTSSANLTPWVMLSLGVDWQLWGLQPQLFYWHQLLAASTVVLLAYQVLRQFFNATASGLAISLFIISIPVADAMQFLMVRHYVEGLAFALLALLSYLYALQAPRWYWLPLGVFAYVLSMTAKEIYVPLVLVLPLLPVGTIEQRSWKLLPYVLAAAAYVWWRHHMLSGGSISGYGMLNAFDFTAILHFPYHFSQVMGWLSHWQLLAMAIVGSWSLYYAVRCWQFSMWLRNSMWLGLVLLPIVPVMGILTSRYLILPWLMLCIACAWLFHELYTSRRWGQLLWVVGLLAAVNVTSLSHATVYQQPLIQRRAAESQFILEHGQTGQILLAPDDSDFHMQSLVWFRQQQGKAGASACYDRCICQLTGQEQFFQYVEGYIQAVDDLPPVQCGVTDKPFAVQLSYAQGTIHWQFAPHTDGQYFAALSLHPFMDGQFLPPLPAQGAYRFAFQGSRYLVIKYHSPAGWVSYSPVLKLKATEQPYQVQWQQAMP